MVTTHHGSVSSSILSISACSWEKCCLRSESSVGALGLGGAHSSCLPVEQLRACQRPMLFIFYFSAIKKLVESLKPSDNLLKLVIFQKQISICSHKVTLFCSVLVSLCLRLNLSWCRVMVFPLKTSSTVVFANRSPR